MLPLENTAKRWGGAEQQPGRKRERAARVSVVIPALNEAENLPHVLPRIPQWVHEVLLVDGRSTDGTAEVARRLRPTVKLVEQDGRGKGAALRSGFAVATGDIVVMLDADGSMDPAEIPAFVGALLSGADFAKGSRFLQGGGTCDMPLYRRLGNRAFVVLANLLFRTHFTDITYGYNAVWRKHEAALALELDGWAQEIISNVRTASRHLRVVEVASFERRRIAGEAKLRTVSAGWVILKAILSERFAGTRDRQTSPAAGPPRGAMKDATRFAGKLGAASERREGRICVVGSGTRFLSGISYYTLQLSNVLSRSHRVSAILMRQLLPTRLYPGRGRVGANLTRQRYEPAVRTFDGVDWHWMPSIFRALWFLWRERPEAVVFQWWSGTVLHSYIILALFTRMLGARVVIEFHEILDTGEARMPLVRAYVRWLAPILMRAAHAFVIHSEYDRPLLERQYHLGRRPVAVIPLSPFNLYRPASGGLCCREAPAGCCNLLFFGVIRPFKGLEDLVRAFDALPADEINSYWLTVVGETWEGWTLPGDLIAHSRYRHRITFVNRYVQDDEVAALFAGADAVVLPYHRSSASGPLQVAMSHGLPVIVTNVGGLTEASVGYEGAVLVPPRDVAALGKALHAVLALRGRRYAAPHSWSHAVAGYIALLRALQERHLALARGTC